MISNSQKIDDISRFLQRDGKRYSPRWLRDFFRRVYGYDIGPYPEVLGQLDAEGKIKCFGERDQWNPERGEFDWTCESVQWKSQKVGSLVVILC